MGLRPALRQTVPAVSGGGREQVLGQAGLHPVHAGAGGTPGSLPGIGLQRASWRTGRRTSQKKGSGPGMTRAARTGRKGLASAISLMSRTGCANSEHGASLGMPAQSAGAITPGPGATVPRWSGGGDTRAGGDQELAWDSKRGEGWWTCEGAGRSPRPRHLETF